MNSRMFHQVNQMIGNNPSTEEESLTDLADVAQDTGLPLANFVLRRMAEGKSLMDSLGDLAEEILTMPLDEARDLINKSEEGAPSE